MTTKPRNLTKAELKRQRLEAAKAALARAQRRRRNLRLALTAAGPASVAMPAAPQYPSRSGRRSCGPGAGSGPLA